MTSDERALPARRLLRGQRALAAALAVALGASCVVVRGKVYPGWRHSLVNVSCASAGDASGPLLRIRLVDTSGDAVEPPVIVKVRRVGEPSSPGVVLRRKTNPAMFDEVPIGRWDLEIEISSAAGPARCTVELQANQVCTVEVVVLDHHETLAALRDSTRGAT